MDKTDKNMTTESARKKFLALSLESTRKSYYPQLQKQLEKAKENEKRLQLLIDNLPAQIFYVNAQEQYVLINREYKNTFGVNSDPVIGKRIKDILGPEDYQKVSPHIQKALSGKPEHFEMTFISKDSGESRWYDINYVPEITDKGIVNGFYALIIDLTEKKQAQEEKARLKDRLRQAQKMEAIGTLSGGIAHDFNNILSGIFGYSQLADAYINDPERAKEYIDKILEGAKRASSLIQQILTFSRQTRYRRQPLNLFIVLREALQLIRSTIPSNITIREAFNTQAMILADSTQIHQVIMNLCTNAYHAMGDDGGVLTVGLDEVDLSGNDIALDTAFNSGRYLRLEVTDTGPGIDPDILEKIFDPYYTTKTMGKGTGLGLAVVNGIVKKHNGFIRVKTELDEGSTFQVYFPVIEKEAALESTEKNSKKIFTGTESLMLVDDETAILDTLKEILTLQGYHVSIFDNGKSALQAFQDNPYQFDLIITDMTMPQLTGDKLSRQILKIRNDIPIIICTGYHESLSEEGAINTGIKKYMLKPVTGSLLLKVIRELLDENSPG